MVRPAHVTFGVGATSSLAGILDSLRAHDILLVADAAAYRHSGAERALADTFSCRKTYTFQDFSPNPKIADVERGVDFLRHIRPQAVVAVGGGSALDIAKLVAACGAQEAAPRDYAVGRRQLTCPGPPLIAIPTTAGTGSEATHFAVAYVDGMKYSVAHPFMLPSYTILDPALTYSLPAKVTAESGLDALCQAIESTWAAGATTASLEYSLRSLELAWGSLEGAVLAPSPDNRAAMLRAAHLAGQAINIAKTTAPHAVSYALTSRFGVPHGAAVALTLSAFLRFNSEVDAASCCDPRGALAVRERIASIVSTLGVETIDEACSKFDALVRTLGCPTRLGEVGVSPRDVELLASQVNVERLANNPRRIDCVSLHALLMALF